MLASDGQDRSRGLSWAEKAGLVLTILCFGSIAIQYCGAEELDSPGSGSVSLRASLDTAPRVESSSSSLDTPTESRAFSPAETPPLQAGREARAGVAAVSAGIPESLVTPDVCEGFTPTPEGLWRMTGERWSQEGFVALTAEEARALLPLDDTLTSAPGSFVELYGLPTREDAEYAFRDYDVQLQLERVLLLELAYWKLCELPTMRRNAQYGEALETQRVVMEDARRTLMRTLDRVSPYKNWSLFNRLFVEWDGE